jgi:hypothetical protein
MAKAKKKAPSKPSKRANKYEEKLQVNATFEELAKALVTPKASTKKGQ